MAQAYGALAQSERLQDRLRRVDPGPSQTGGAFCPIWGTARYWRSWASTRYVRSAYAVLESMLLICGPYELKEQDPNA